MNNKPMLNAYPDSMGGRLSDIVEILSTEDMKDVFASFYILPSIYHSDLDRGFSVIDYNINEELADWKDLDKLKSLGIDLKLDFILNHASAQSLQFTDLVKHGEQSEYKDFFINWNDFWKGYGSMTEAGYIKPDPEYLDKMFFRKPGLPILMVKFPDGKKVPYWNTFYQEEHYPQYLGQMDLNIKSPKVWDFYKDTLKKIASYGAEIVRLDAFAYAPKEPGEKNFLNEPGTWDLLSQIQEIADPYKLTLLPEIHAAYEEQIYKKISDKGYMTYDFFLPGLVIDAIENKRSNYLAEWARELVDNDIKVVNMLGCHDGIPLLDLKGILPEEDIQNLIDLIVARGGLVKNLHGQKNIYYQVNATYFSALGESEQKLLMARAIQLFMPGKPQIWYLDLLAGKNDHEAVKKAGESGHKEINRTNLTLDEVNEALKKEILQKQIEMIRFRNTCKAFDEGAQISIEESAGILRIIWNKESFGAELTMDFINEKYVINEIVAGKKLTVCE
ncbi:MAG: sucrose phosphorylase [Agathobacter sp.]|nr:sucrose phosphorylase [Agathobacter sp.]